MDGGMRQKASVRHTSVSAYIFRKRQTSVRQPLTAYQAYSCWRFPKKKTGNTADYKIMPDEQDYLNYQSYKNIVKLRNP